MATTAHVSIDEYLAYTGKPNCEYIDGVLRPKAMGTSKHAKLQGRLFRLLEDLGYEAAVELTVQVSPTKFLVPDVAADMHFADPYPDRPVLLCVEILSPGDRSSELLTKCEEYHRWGVPYCWVIDPVVEKAWEYHRDGAVQQCSTALHAGAINIPLSALF